jgi:CPA2 family monovalent cation:H+ antiporter-2
VFYADAASEEALGHAHLTDAKALVLLMNDPATAQRVVDTARRISPTVPILIRARYLAERESLRKLGATDVIVEEVEAGSETLSRLLRRLDVPGSAIQACLQAVRDATHPAVSHTLTDQESAGLPLHAPDETAGKGAMS